MNYALHLLVYLDIYVIVALSLNLVVGYSGLLTLAHAGYYAVGAYAYALLSIQFGWGFVPATLAGAVLAAAFSFAISLPSWRLRGDMFVLVTLAVQALIFSSLYNWQTEGAPLGSWRNLTNGPFGITGVPKPHVLGRAVNSPAAMAAFATLVTALCAAVLWRLTRSPWGRLLQVIRDDELAARGLGKRSRLVKVQVFAISSATVAIAGALYASHVRYIDPSSASLEEGILMLSMVLVGGAGNFTGPVVGAVTLILLPELLRSIVIPESIAANVRVLIYGLLLVIFMHSRPQGIAGLYRIR